MTLVDQNVSDKILKKLTNKKRFWWVSSKYNGGNLTSRIKFIFLWKSQDDELGDEFISDMEKTKLNFLQTIHSRFADCKMYSFCFTRQ